MAHPMDSMARQRGFPDYPTMQAFYRNRAQSLGGQQNQAAPPPQTNFLQSLVNTIPWAPGHILGYVNDRVNSALGRRP